MVGNSLRVIGWRVEPMKINQNPPEVTGGDAQHAAASASMAADAAQRPFSAARKTPSDRTNCPKHTAKTGHGDPFHPLIITICSPGVQRQCAACAHGATTIAFTTVDGSIPVVMVTFLLFFLVWPLLFWRRVF